MTGTSIAALVLGLLGSSAIFYLYLELQKANAKKKDAEVEAVRAKVDAKIAVKMNECTRQAMEISDEEDPEAIMARIRSIVDFHRKRRMRQHGGGGQAKE